MKPKEPMLYFITAFLSQHFYHGPELHNLSKLQSYETKNENNQIKFQKLYLKLVIISF
jgi:hypothetical protein